MTPGVKKRRATSMLGDDSEEAKAIKNANSMTESKKNRCA
jgi:hypothetical protein